MSEQENNSPWLCHICDHSSTIGEGLVCSECYKIACATHMLQTTALNRVSGLYEIIPLCVECQLKKEL